VPLPEKYSASHRPPTLLALPSYLAGNVARLGNGTLVAVLREHDLRLAHFAVLVALSDFGELAPHELATRLQTDRSHISAAIETLVQGGWVARAQDSSDRRRATINLTGPGRDRLTGLVLAAEESEKSLLAALSDTEQVTLRELLRKIILAAETPDAPAGECD
jgi:MarR family transcriptional regulator, lower aerobic nicotinate degradation pathway regulator